MNDKILLFIPCYIFEKQIVRVLGQFNNEVLKCITEVIVVNNISTDNTEQTAIDYINDHNLKNFSVLRNDQNYGLGGSHKVAFDYAIKNNFDYVIVLHGDDQGDISNIMPYLENKEYQNYDCFLGARFMKGSQLQGYSKFRTFGNNVYNLLFSIGCGKRIYDLGSGLNMYNVSTLKNNYYHQYSDNLVFNYCMIMGTTYFKQNIKFFPIIWREDDQVSNVKMVSQATNVLKLLFKYVLNKKKFLSLEHRTKVIDNYSAKVLFTTKD